MRRVAAAFVGLMIAAGCGSSGPTYSQRASSMMTSACVQFAKTFLTTDPNSGLQQITLQQGIGQIQQAVTTANNAAAYDKKWAPGAAALKALWEAMRLQDDTQMKAALPKVQGVCTPLISKFSEGTTVP